MKNLIFTLLMVSFSFFFQASAQAQVVPMNYPYYGTYPGYVYPGYMSAPYIMCFAQGLANGAVFYGVGYNVYAANQWAMYACQSTGQYCQLTGCRY